MIYTVTLNPAIDYVMQLSQPLNPGAINRSNREDYQFGGKGINVSNVLHTLGMDTIALGFIAGFTGKALEEGLQRMGLKTQLIPVSQGHTRINVKIKGGLETELNGSGPVISPEDLEILCRKLEALSPEDILVLSGSVPGCLNADTYGKLLSRLEGKRILTVVDAAGPLLLNTLPYRPFLIKPNRQELESLAGCALPTDEDLIRFARTLQDTGARNILISLGGDGALLLDESGHTYRMGCPSGTLVNSVGAGDSMVAGFLTGWLKTGSPYQALKLGIAAGSATAFSLGLTDQATVHALLAQL